MRTPSILVLATALVLPTLAAAGPSKDLVERTRDTLETLVALDTRNPPGGERAACEWARDSLAADGIEVEILGPEGPRANLVARVPTRSRRPAPPLLIVAHIDVVGTAGQEWTTDPLTLTEVDGFVHGRGVIDNKGMAAASIEILRDLAGGRSRLKRDVILVLAADEESGGRVGTGWLLENHPESIQAGIVVNEGGDVRLIDGEVGYVGIQTTEKISRTVHLVATGPDGHSSMPLRENAIVDLAAAITAAATVEFDMRTSPTTRAFLEGVAPTLPEPLAGAAAAAAAVEPGAAIPTDAAEILGADPFFGAFLRTTCVTTMLEAGTRVNALPSSARATVNCRLLPDEDPAAVVSALQVAVEPYGVTVEDTSTEKVSPVSPESGPFFAATSRASGKIWPGAEVVPFMSTGGTDCRRFRTAGTDCYGLLPFPLTAEDERRMHGTDERLPLDSLDQGTRFLWELIVTLGK